jgi:hypothetical protein
LRITTRLYPNPRITGFEIAGPVDNCEIPGCLLMASTIFTDMFLRSSCFLTIVIGDGIRFACVAELTPVMTTAFRSAISGERTKSFCMSPLISMYSEIVE